MLLKAPHLPWKENLESEMPSKRIREPKFDVAKRLVNWELLSGFNLIFRKKTIQYCTVIGRVAWMDAALP